MAIDTIEYLLYESSQWAKKKYPAQMAANAHQAPEITKEAKGKMREGHILTWFLFQWVNPDTGITPAEEYARGPNGGPIMVEMVRYITQLTYDTFRVLKMARDGTGIVDSFTTGKQYHVVFRVGHGNIKENDLFVGYIHPWNNGMYYTIGTIINAGTIPREFITPGMTNHLLQRYQEERQERYESVSITRRTGIKTYLKSQPAEHVAKVAGSLGVSGGTKKRNIEMIWKVLTGEGMVDAVRSLSNAHMQCLMTVAATGFMKRYVLERRADGNAKVVLDLYEHGFLMLGTMVFGSRRHKIVAVPADILRNMKRYGLPNLRAGFDA